MGKIFSTLGREIKLGFKTVMFHFKQYFCFYVAILAMEIMFGIIVMSSSNNIYQHKKNIEDDYDYHIAMTNLDEGQRDYYKLHKTIKNDPYYDVEVDDNFVYIRFNTDVSENETEVVTLEALYDQFLTKYAKKTPNMKLEEINIQFSPLYQLESTVFDMRLACAAKLVVLALVSIAVIILLLNIRLNHFKFTYGIYMSFGADTKKLFSTSFWEMMVIGLLMLLPAGGIATAVDWYFYVSEDYKYHFAPWLMAYGLAFIIPVFLTAVFLPIKATASKPPLKLLLAEDNSNLVSSPRISTQLFGKKFPKAYEGLGLWRFRRYCATLVASSVLFASIFVWISFFRDIHEFDTNQAKAEFTINLKHEIETETVWQVPDKIEAKHIATDEFRQARNKVYNDTALLTNSGLIYDFEKYYTDAYKITRTPEGKVSDVFEAESKQNVSSAYNEARKRVVKDRMFVEGSSTVVNEELNDYKELEKYLNNERYEIRRDADNSVTEVIKKVQVTVETEIYERLTNSQEDELESIAMRNEGYLYMQCVSDALSDFAYVSFDKQDVKFTSGFNINPTDKSQRVTTDVDFYAADDDRNVIAYLQNEEHGYEYEGDLDMVYDGNYVIVSETMANRTVLKIKPGDKIRIAVLKELTKEPAQKMESDRYLDYVIQNGTFEFKEFEVCAVIKNMPTTDHLPVFLNPENFEAVTGAPEAFNQISVYVNSSLTSKQVDDLHVSLVGWAEDFANVKWNNAVEQSRANREERDLPVIQMIALFALILSPLFWFFSQIMFFGKRQKEFEILRGLGATEKEVKKIFRKNGIILALLGALATVVFSFIGAYIIYKIDLTFVARLNVEAKMLYSFNMPWIPLAAAVVLTLICGYASAMIPYRIEKKLSKKKISVEFGE